MYVCNICMYAKWLPSWNKAIIIMIENCVFPERGTHFMHKHATAYLTKPHKAVALHRHMKDVKKKKVEIKQTQKVSQLTGWKARQVLWPSIQHHTTKTSTASQAIFPRRLLAAYSSSENSNFLECYPRKPALQLGTFLKLPKNRALTTI